MSEAGKNPERDQYQIQIVKYIRIKNYYTLHQKLSPSLTGNGEDVDVTELLELGVFYQKRVQHEYDISTRLEFFLKDILEPCCICYIETRITITDLGGKQVNIDSL